MVNTADRVRLCSATSLRVEVGRLVGCPTQYRCCPDHTFQREFVDAVNRVPFRVSCFSGNGDYIAAGPSRKSAPHSIYIWNRLDGSLLALLDGPLRGIIAIQWHSHKPVIVAVMSTGEPVVWSKNVSENWQAFVPTLDVVKRWWLLTRRVWIRFAPDFVELEENVVFDESQLDDMPVVAPNVVVSHWNRRTPVSSDLSHRQWKRLLTF